MMSAAEEARITKLLSKYKDINATKKEVINVLTNYRSLSFSLRKFVFDDASTKDLCNLHGTIPVVFRYNTYYIPICIWLYDTHPIHAPKCYVTPTPTMQIKVSMYVDHSGRIYLPYLHYWQPKSSDLLSLVQVLIVTFGKHPPVYSKPKEQQATPYSTSSFMLQPGAAGASSDSVNKEVNSSAIRDGANKCIVCQDNTANTVLLPCKHMKFCNECVLKLQALALTNDSNFYSCPFCRAKVDHSMKLFV